VPLLAFAADRRAAVHCAAVTPLLLGASGAEIDQYLLIAGPTAANPPHAAPAVDSWQRQMDRQPGRWTDTDPAAACIVCDYFNVRSKADMSQLNLPHGRLSGVEKAGY